MKEETRKAVFLGLVIAVFLSITVVATLVGGKAKNMPAGKRKEKIKGRGAVGKTIVQGVLQRGGTMIAGVVGNAKRRTLQPNIAAQWKPARRSIPMR